MAGLPDTFYTVVGKSPSELITGSFLAFAGAIGKRSNGSL